MEVPLKNGGSEIFKKLFILTIVTALNSGMELMDREGLDSEYASPLATSAYTTTFIHEGREFTLDSSKTTWNEAKFICQSWNSTLAILDDFEKALYLAEALAETEQYMESVWIGSRKDSETNAFYWITSRKALPRTQSNMWNAHQVQKPSGQSSFPAWLNTTDASMSAQRADCVAMQRGHHDEPIFVNLYCNAKRGFACEKAAESNDISSEIEEVIEVQCGKTLYKIFTMKTVWAEAVRICNSYGMSLATFNSVRCVEKIGSKMMKMRPSLENAWIGGKGEGGEWSWLSTGELISESGMQNSQDPLQEKWPPFRERAHLKSQGCLMVDRQVCNETVFLEARCNRVNSFICQKDIIPPDNNVTENIRNQFLYEDPKNYYALIPEALPYSEAIRYCEMLNGSLASLTKKDMLVNLLQTMELDIQKPIKHIWISGKLVQDPSTGRLGWTDPNTGMPLSGSEGNLPWCEDEDEDEPEEACLNLDRESTLEAIIYGMPCDTKQNFICVIEKFEKSSEPSGSKLQIPTSSVFQQQVQQTEMNGQQPNGPPPFGGQNPPPFGGQQPPSFGVQNPPLFGNLPQPQQSFPSQQPLQTLPQYVGQQQPSGLPQLMPSVMRKNDFPERSSSPTANLPNSYGPSEFSD